MKLTSCNQEMGDTESLLCPGAPQGSAQYENNGVSRFVGQRVWGLEEVVDTVIQGMHNTCALFRIVWAAYLKVCMCVHLYMCARVCVFIWFRASSQSSNLYPY